MTIASLTPTPYLPPQVFDIWDKAQHAGAFLLLGGLGLLAYPASALRVILGLLVFGGGIELGSDSLLDFFFWRFAGEASGSAAGGVAPDTPAMGYFWPIAVSVFRLACGWAQRVF